MGFGFRCLLILANGEPADPAAFVTANPQWEPSDRFTAGDGSRWRIVAIEPNLKRRRRVRRAVDGGAARLRATDGSAGSSAHFCAHPRSSVYTRDDEKGC